MPEKEQGKTQHSTCGGHIGINASEKKTAEGVGLQAYSTNQNNKKLCRS